MLSTGCDRGPVEPGASEPIHLAAASAPSSGSEPQLGDQALIPPELAAPGAGALPPELERDPEYACRWSFEQTQRMVDEAGGAIKTPDGFPAITRPEYGTFMRACLEYPREVQKCLVFKYAFKYNQRCREARAVFDAENQRRAADLARSEAR